MGVEIEITPAGKSTKRLTLLSGGEKSMTALAFLFAVFLARPCPFYILDEVEAALDDLNIDRFLKVLRSFSGRAQFIVVTHQKRTMEAADSLYGVSMAGNGVSKVISRRLPQERGGGRMTDDIDEPTPARRRGSASVDSARPASSAARGVVGSAGVVGQRGRRGLRPRVVGSAGVTRQHGRRRQRGRRRSAGIVGSAGILFGLGNVGCAGCVGVHRLRRLPGLRRLHRLRRPQGRRRQDRRPQEVTIRRAIPNLLVDDIDAARASTTASSASTSRWTSPGFVMFASPSNRTAQITVADANTPGLDRGVSEARSQSRSRTSTRCTPRPSRSGLEIVYPLTNEPWGIRRFFVRSPDGTVINVAKHL